MNLTHLHIVKLNTAGHRPKLQLSTSTTPQPAREYREHFLAKWLCYGHTAGWFVVCFCFLCRYSNHSSFHSIDKNTKTKRQSWSDPTIASAATIQRRSSHNNKNTNSNGIHNHKRGDACNRRNGWLDVWMEYGPSVTPNNNGDAKDASMVSFCFQPNQQSHQINDKEMKIMS